MKLKRHVTRVALVCLYPDRVDVAGPLSWFDVIVRAVTHYGDGDYKAVDQVGRVFAHATMTATMMPLVRLTRGGLVIAKEGGDITPAQAIEAVEQWPWRAPVLCDDYREAGIDAIAKNIAALKKVASV